MSALISGALINGAGVPMAECKIYLDALVNTSEVVTESFAVIETDAAGQYAFEAQKGKYTVHIKQKNGPKCCVGDISVYDDSKPGTLNDFLTALDEGDLKPDVVKRFEEMVAQAQQSAEAAAESEQQAGQHVADAQQIKSDCETLADNVRQNAEVVAEDKLQVETLATQIEDTASEVRQDAEAAKKAASDAEQAKSDIDAALSATLKTMNHLSEIAAEGEEAQQESRNNLGLKSASTMESQSDIYDRTEGCLAIPGAFGFGALFKYGEEIKFSAERGPAEFLQWVRETPPGRYLVSQFGGSKKNPIITGPSTLVFSGYLDIEIRTDTTPENQQKETKQVIFKGINGESYTARIHSGITPATLPDSWEKKLLKVDDFTRVLYSWTDSYYNLPDIGGLVLAAYTGDSDSESKKTLIRGRSYSGSRLRQATFYADFRSSGFESGPTALVGGADLSGTYISLSSTDSVSVYTRAVVGLFMRIA
ncbi:TPA: prophage tail fiber N-terminal domain-containing protein [Escherichia coli]